MFSDNKFDMRIAIETNNKAALFKGQKKLQRQYEKLRRQTLELNDIYEEVIL